MYVVHVCLQSDLELSQLTGYVFSFKADTSVGKRRGLLQMGLEFSPPT